MGSVRTQKLPARARAFFARTERGASATAATAELRWNTSKDPFSLLPRPLQVAVYSENVEHLEVAMAAWTFDDVPLPSR